MHSNKNCSRSLCRNWQTNSKIYTSPLGSIAAFTSKPHSFWTPCTRTRPFFFYWIYWGDIDSQNHAGFKCTTEQNAICTLQQVSITPRKVSFHPLYPLSAHFYVPPPPFPLAIPHYCLCLSIIYIHTYTRQREKSIDIYTYLYTYTHTCIHTYIYYFA